MATAYLLQIPKHHQLNGNEEQIASFKIIINHFQKLLIWENTVDTERNSLQPPEQLLMTILGEGGTGKSHLIGLVQRYFHDCNMGHIIQIAAFTNAAATPLNGKALHSHFKIHVEDKKSRKSSENTVKKDHDLKLEMSSEYWRKLRYLVIDEVSFLNFKLLEQVYETERESWYTC